MTTMTKSKRLYRVVQDNPDSREYGIYHNRPGGSRVAGYIPSYPAAYRMCAALNGTSSEHKTLKALQQTLDGQTWSPDTLDRIAEILRGSGYAIGEPRG